ncbi:MAG TPA: hypothetical protein VFY60_03085 [Pyrinomonadaceae bacterium]|nr:hypothetical protein [Pyrinomonadaceae bacterium]
MSTILERLEMTGTAMQNAAIRDKLGNDLKKAAIKAMMNGIDSPEWVSYMSLFAENAEQLNRLTVPQPDEETWQTESRAYIVANSICGADSTTRTRLRVANDIDVGIISTADGSIVDPVDGQDPPDGAIVRPFSIPQV